MTLEIERKLAELERMTVRELQRYSRETFGETPPSRHKQHLLHRIAWRLQAQAEGGLSERARRRAEELARDADLRVRASRGQPDAASTPKLAVQPPRDPRLPMPGTLLVRSYRGETRQVKVLDDGFEYDGRLYRTLTAVTKRITGQHWNGYHFFGLPRKRNAS